MRRMAFFAAFMAGSLAASPDTPVTAAPVPRDVVRSAFSYPFLTDVEVELRLSDGRARVRSDGGEALFRYPGIRGVSVDETVVPGASLTHDLYRAALPAGLHEVRVLVGGQTARSNSLPAGGLSTAQDLTQAVEAASPGGEIVVRDGVYSDWRVLLTGRGTATKPVTVRPATPGGVTFRRDTRLVLQGTGLVLRAFRFEQCGPGTTVDLVEADDCRLTQCQFFGCGDPQSTFGHVVEVDLGSDRNRVDHCYFTGSKSMSLAQRVNASGAGQDNRFDHNLFRDLYRYWINGQENIQIGQNQRGTSGAVEPHCLVEFNVFDHAWGDTEILSNKSSSNVIRYNLAAHCYHSAFTLRGGNGVRFEGNVMVDNADGLRVMGKRHTLVNNVFRNLPGVGVLLETGHRDGESNVATDETLIAHNTFVDCFGGALSGEPTTTSRPHAPARNLFVNNLVVGFGGGMIDTADLRETVIRSNLFWADDGGPAPSPAALGEHPLVADPRLKAQDPWLRPAPDSPVCGRAEPLPAVTLDALGHRRPSNAAGDLGAVQSSPDQAAPTSVELPPVPPKPLLDFSLYTGELLFAQDPNDPLNGWRVGPRVSAVPGAIQMADGSLQLSQPLPADFLLTWEQQAATFDAVATVEFCAGETAGYRLRWGGADQAGKPLGVIELSKQGDQVVADAADLLYYRKDYTYKGGMSFTPRKDTKPDPKQWYRFALLKRGGQLCLFMNSARPRSADPLPVLLWEDTGVVGGPVPAGTMLRLHQQGEGRWRNLALWSSEYQGDRPPSPPTVTVRAVGGQRVSLRWGETSPSQRCEVRRDGRLLTAAAGQGYDDFDVKPRTHYRYEVVSRNSLGLRSMPASVEVDTKAGGPFYQQLPASAAEEVTAPLRLTRFDPSEPLFLWAPGASAAMDAPPDTGGAVFGFSVPEAGEYALWGLVQTPNRSSDSFYIRLDGQAESKFDTWSTGVHPAWSWSCLRNAVHLNQGEHRLTLKHREPTSRLAALLVTDDLAFAPEEE